MKALQNELYKFFSQRMVKIIYAVAAVIILLMQIMLPFSPKDQLLAPGITAQMVFGAFYGVLIAFLTGKVWEQDMRGTIINIVSTGNGRAGYFIDKSIVIAVNSLLMSFFISAVVLIYALLTGALELGFSTDDIIVSNIASWSIMFLVTLAESLIATVIYLTCLNFRNAVFISSLVAFMEYLITLIFIRTSGILLSPIGLFFRTANNIGKETLLNSLKQGAFMLAVYILTCECIFYVRCKNNEY